MLPFQFNTEDNKFLTLNIGHVLTMLGMAGMSLMWWGQQQEIRGRLDGRIAALEEKHRHDDDRISALTISISDIRTDVSYIRGRMGDRRGEIVPVVPGFSQPPG